ncbi:hypothetical protein V8C40DRAFT_258542, partial [Trichoderma camerunense]
MNGFMLLREGLSIITTIKRILRLLHCLLLARFLMAISWQEKERGVSLCTARLSGYRADVIIVLALRCWSDVPRLSGVASMIPMFSAKITTK